MLKRIEISKKELGTITWKLPPSLVEHLEEMALGLSPEKREPFRQVARRLAGDPLARVASVVTAALYTSSKTIQILHNLHEAISAITAEVEEITQELKAEGSRFH